MADERKKPNHLPLSTNPAGVKQDIIYAKGKPLFLQNDACDALYFIQEGSVKVSIVSRHGKEAVIAILKASSFCGEGCMTGQTARAHSAIAMTDCVVTRLERAAALELLRSDTHFAGQFTAYLLARNIRVEADLVDQLFNSSERRLARLLLNLANFGKEGVPEPLIHAISQETLADMIGTTRSRVSFFMNKFRQLGYINYNGHIEVHNSLLNVLLHDDREKNGE